MKCSSCEPSSPTGRREKGFTFAWQPTFSSLRSFLVHFSRFSASSQTRQVPGNLQSTAHNRVYGEGIEGAVGKNMLCAFPLGL